MIFLILKTYQKMCIICETNGILPEDMKDLTCIGCPNLIELPEHLPKGLEVLFCVWCNNLTQLPEHLPKGLKWLHCELENLIELPKHLPKNLKKLNCGWCVKLIKLPKHLPESLEELYCYGCENLIELPIPLPKGLKEFDCSGCTSLIYLPIHDSIKNISEELKDQIERNYEAHRKKMCKQNINIILEELIMVTWEPYRASLWCWDNEEKEFLGFL
jgi:hypothetical protein